MNFIKLITLNNQFKNLIITNKIKRREYSKLNYIQGQYVKEDSKIREYFYYITEEGYLFLDDTKFKNFTSCFKDREFLKFFFDRIIINKTDRYSHQFPFISRCGYERNYINVDDTCIVYTHIIDDLISYNYGGNLLTNKFNIEDICMCPITGRVYYPTFNETRFGKIGLIRSKLSIELSKCFIFDKMDEQIDKYEFDEPNAINWNGKIIKLSKKIRPYLLERNKEFKFKNV